MSEELHRLVAPAAQRRPAAVQHQVGNTRGGAAKGEAREGVLMLHLESSGGVFCPQGI